MSNTNIVIRRTSTPGKIPNTTNMSTGMLALNMNDEILYSMDTSNNVFIIGANVVTQYVTSNLIVGNSTVGVRANSSSLYLANSSANLFAVNTSGVIVGNGDGLKNTSRYNDIINVLDYNAKGDGSTDDTIAIQNAIDNAFSEGVSTVLFPSGHIYVITNTVYADLPMNRGANLHSTTPGVSFSMELTSGGTCQNLGAIIQTTFTNATAIYVGPGRGMTVKGLSIYGKSQTQPGCLGWDKNFIAILVADYASMTLIDNCNINAFYCGIQFGDTWTDKLTDSNTVRKTTILDCAYGVYFTNSNQLINSVEDCVIGARYSVCSPVWQGTQIRGGNFSCSGGYANTFSCSNVVVSPSDTGAIVTCVVANPDIIFLANAYNAFVMQTNNISYVPLTLNSYNPSGNVANLQIYDSWFRRYYFYSNTAQLVTQVQAVNSFYAAELVTTFSGYFIDAQHVHIENASTPTIIYDGTLSSRGTHSSLRNIRFSGDITLSEFGPNYPSNSYGAQYAIARSFPQLIVGSGEVEASYWAFNYNISDATNENLIIDQYNNGDKLKWRGYPPKLQCRMDAFDSATYSFVYGENGEFGDGLGASGLGFGEYEENPFYSGYDFSHDYDLWKGPKGMGKVPMIGVMPAPYATPMINTSHYSTLIGTLPTINLASTILGYPLLWGGKNYVVTDGATNVASFMISSQHHFYSYGQSLPISWSYLANTSWLYVSNTTFLFCGLGVVLNNGSSNTLYIIDQVFPQQNAVTVFPYKTINIPTPFLVGNSSGNIATIYTGSSIDQESYSFFVEGTSIANSTGITITV